jgi:hypothetical protein
MFFNWQIIHTHIFPRNGDDHVASDATLLRTDILQDGDGYHSGETG